MSSTRRKGSPVFSDALDSIFSEIHDFQVEISTSPTAFFLRPQKYSPKATPSPAKISHLRPNIKPICKAKELLIEPYAQFPAEVPNLPTTPTVIPAKWSFGPENMRLSTLLPRESPRFPPITFREKIAAYKPSIRALSPEEIQQITQRIELNIAKARAYTPTARAEVARRRATDATTRSTLRRTVKKELHLEKQRRRVEEFEGKIRRFEWRRNAEEVGKGKEWWVGGLIALGVIGVWKGKMRARKALHSRAKGLLLWLLAVAWTCGKLIRSVKLKRRKQALRTLRQLRPYLKRFKAALKLRKSELIADLLADNLNRKAFRRLIKLWKGKIEKLQWAVRSLVTVRAAQRLLLLLQWERLEAAGGVQRVVQYHVKDMIIRETIRKRVKTHAQALKKWAESVQIAILETSANEVLGLLSPSSQPELPPKPRYRPILTSDELERMVKSTERQHHPRRTRFHRY